MEKLNMMKKKFLKNIEKIDKELSGKTYYDYNYKKGEKYKVNEYNNLLAQYIKDFDSGGKIMPNYGVISNNIKNLANIDFFSEKYDKADLERSKKYLRRLKMIKSIVDNRNYFLPRGYRDRHGFDKDGFDKDGFDKDGFDKDGFDRGGINREGYDRMGLTRKDYELIKQQKQGKGLKITTPKQMLSRLPVLLSKIHAGNNSTKLKNEIRQLLYSLYRSKKISKTIYNNLIATV